MIIFHFMTKKLEVSRCTSADTETWILDTEVDPDTCMVQRHLRTTLNKGKGRISPRSILSAAVLFCPGLRINLFLHTNRRTHARASTTHSHARNRILSQTTTISLSSTASIPRNTTMHSNTDLRSAKPSHSTICNFKLFVSLETKKNNHWHQLFCGSNFNKDITSE